MTVTEENLRWLEGTGADELYLVVIHLPEGTTLRIRPDLTVETDR